MTLMTARYNAHLGIMLNPVIVINAVFLARLVPAHPNVSPAFRALTTIPARHPVCWTVRVRVSTIMWTRVVSHASIHVGHAMGMEVTVWAAHWHRMEVPFTCPLAVVWPVAHLAITPMIVESVTSVMDSVQHAQPSTTAPVVWQGTFTTVSATVHAP